ncbi:ASPIC and UnbV [Polaribacter sp. KT25b]|nr:ASPIC and UnbV [Polaribacter sp. KT25b]
MILIEHSWRVLIFWNNGGAFSKPKVLTKGDLHGVTIADYDFDGLINLIVVQGGGGGSKPRNPLLYQINKDRTIVRGSQIEGLEKMRGRASKLIDNDSNGILDLLITGFPTPEQLKNGANNFHSNDGKGNFTFLNKLPKGDRLSYKTLLTDFNNDTISDFIFYGGKNIIAVKGEKGMTFSEADKNVLGDAAKTIEASSISEIDFDNDGDFDLFITSAAHAFNNIDFYDKENKRFAFFERFKPYTIEKLKIDGNFKIENVQMSYPNFDVFIGKNKQKLDIKNMSKDYKNFSLTQKEAKGFPSETKKNGLYIGYVGNGYWKVHADTKAAPTAGVIHNVIEAPELISTEKMHAKLLENRNGIFVDVTTKMGISIPEQTTGATVGDFNNDGFSDLFVVRFGNPASENKQILLMNQKGKSFKNIKNHNIISKELGAVGSQAQTIDYDADGDQDIIYANERGNWHLYTNNSINNNNFITIKVGNSPNKDTSPQGAILTIKTCNNIYKRVVGATSSPYSQGLNTALHIGLGKCNKIEEAKILWTNGEELAFDINEINTSIFVGKN